MLLGGALLILLQTVVRAGIVLPSYYWQDDFHARRAGPPAGAVAGFLVRDYSGHLEVGQYFLYWLIGRDGGLSFVPAALSLLGMQLVASCLLLAVLRQLFGRSPWVLVPFAGYLFTPAGPAGGDLVGRGAAGDAPADHDAAGAPGARPGRTAAFVAVGGRRGRRTGAGACCSGRRQC